MRDIFLFSKETKLGAKTEQNRQCDVTYLRATGNPKERSNATLTFPPGRVATVYRYLRFADTIRSCSTFRPLSVDVQLRYFTEPGVHGIYIERALCTTSCILLGIERSRTCARCTRHKFQRPYRFVNHISSVAAVCRTRTRVSLKPTRTFHGKGSIFPFFFLFSLCVSGLFSLRKTSRRRTIYDVIRRRGSKFVSGSFRNKQVEMKGVPYYPRRRVYRDFWSLVPETRCNLLKTLNEKSKSETNVFCCANRSLLNAERRIEGLGFP